MNVGNVVTLAALMGAGYLIVDALKKRDTTQKAVASFVSPVRNSEMVNISKESKIGFIDPYLASSGNRPQDMGYAQRMFETLYGYD